MGDIVPNDSTVLISPILWQTHGCRIMTFVDQHFGEDYKIIFDKETHHIIGLKFPTKETADQVHTYFKLTEMKFIKDNTQQ